MRRVWGITAAMAAVFIVVLPGSASAFDAKLKRYPYLTDLVGTSVMVNWATDISATSAVVKYGLNGSTCNTTTVTATRTFILVNGVSEYQWKAQLTGLAADTEYCYRVYFGSAQLDLLAPDASPVFRTQVPTGSSAPFKFAVFGDWGSVGATGNQDQTNVISQIAQSGARFALTTGDNALQVGSQKNYGDLYQTGADTSGVFGPSFWKVAGASLPLFPALGNHDQNNSNALVNWPQDTAVATSGGRYAMDTYCCVNGTTSSSYPSSWYAFDAGAARFYVLKAAWDDSNPGTADLYKNDYDANWAPGTPQRQWLENDLASNPRALRFVFFHFPLRSDNQGESSDPYLHGAGSLEGLFKQYDVTLAFNGHAHDYQRNTAPAGGIPSYVTGGGGAPPQTIGTDGCSPEDAYGIGWSTSLNAGSACGSAPVPDARDRVHHFLLVSVSGTSVTVTPTDELGRTFDPVSYNAPALSANLSLTSSDSPDPVLQGQELTYTLTVGNGGPRAASGVQLTDTLPSGVTFESAVPSQGTCSQTSGTVSCSMGTIASGGGALVTIKVRPQNTGSITNNATVASNVNDPVTSNNSTSGGTTVNPAADLAVTNTDSPDPVAVGQQLTYTVGVANAGPSSATGITLTDTLPAGVTFNSATPSQGSCSQSGGTVTCSLGTLANTAGASVSIKVTPQSLGTITNQANVTSLTGDSNGINNGASQQTTVNASADLSLTKTDAPDPVLVGQLLTYSLTVSNAGPSAATSVTITDTLPSGVTFDSAIASQGTCTESSGTVTCQLGTINSGLNATASIKVRPQSQGSITNQASVSSAAIDTNLANNSASASTTVNPVADLSVTKTDSPDPVLVNQELTYAVGVQNNGPSTATSVTVSDTLPAGVTYVSATPSQGTCSQSAGTVSCSLGAIANGSSASVQIKVVPPTNGSITNQATASSSVSDPNSANNTATATTTVRRSADLSITKSDSPDPVLQGQEVTYTLGVHNAGPSVASDVTVTDTLPSGVTFNSATTSQGSCSQSAGVVTCLLGDMNIGSNVSVQVKVTPQSAGSITNQASVSSITTDPQAANNNASATTTVDPVADLSITKSDSPDPVSSGQELTYGITVHNAGPSSSSGVTVTDTLPSGVTYTSATPSQGTCSQASGTVTCSLGTVVTGANASVDIKVVPTSGTSITNQATVSATTVDPVLVNNAASATTTVDPVADLSLTKSDSPDPVLSGHQLTYTLGVHNSGPASAPSVSLSDALPAGVNFVSATSTQGSCVRVGNTVTCALGTLTSGANVTIEIKVDTGAPGTITNEATVLSTATDPNTNNNSAGATTTVRPIADLGLTKSDSPDPVLAGQLLTYTLGVSNAGPHAATGVTLTDTLPGGVTFDSATASQGTCTESAGTVTCAIGTIANGSNATATIKVRPQAEGSVSNSASVTSDAGDLNQSNNTAGATTTVDPAADLELSQTDSPDPALVGQQITYNLTVHNAGPSATGGVALSDTLPAGVTYDSASSSQGSCFRSGNTVLCSLGTLASGANATVQIKVTPTAPGTITNNANVLGIIVDPDTADNGSAQDTQVTPAADLSLTKSDSPDPVQAGDLLTYTLGVHNSGPNGADGVTVTDTLPAGVVFDSAVPSQGSCGESSGIVTCALGTVANGANASVVVKVRPQNGGDVTNQAAVSSDYGDPAPGNNSASTTTTVTPVADLALTKGDSPDPVLAGELLTYTLTATNGGPSSAAGVTLVDTLPGDATFESATPTQGSCSESGGTVTCQLGTVANGNTATVEIKVRPQSGGTITNEAGVSSDANDPAPGNNSATAETTVIAAADLSLTKGDSPDPVLEGELLTYTLTAHNAGPQPATGVTLTDTLPSGATFDSATPSQGSCGESAGTVTCALGTIGDDQDATVEIKVQPSGPGTLTNEASISSDLADPDSGDTTASAETTVRPVADLSLTKADSPDPVLAGELLTYTLGVDNSGPRDATSTTLVDTLPAGVTFDSATPSQGTCAEVSGTVTCDLGTVADSASASVEIKVRPQSSGSITNNAEVTATEGDTNASDNSASSETAVDPAADLSLTKADSPDPVLAGELLTYTLSVQNAGPSTASGVTLSDTLPAGVAFDSATPSQGSCSESGGTVTCPLGNIADDQGASVDIKVRPSAPGSLSNAANVISLVADPGPSDNAATADTTVDAAADLSLTKSDSPDPVFVDDLLTYTLTAHNSGPQDATGVTLTDTLPSGVTYESATPTQGTCVEATGTVTCDLGTLTDEQSAGVEITVRPQSPGTITNNASVTSDLADPDSADASASENTTVRAIADLGLTKTDSPDPVLAGELLTYTLSVSNSGPQSATGVVVTDTLPAATFVSATPSQGTCSESGGTVTCPLGTIANGNGASIEIKIRRSTPGIITNEAQVTADTHDPTPENDSASEDTTVDPAADVSVTQSDAPDPVLAGELLAYTLTAHNSGPQTATSVTLTDTLPGGVTYDSATPSQGTCNQSAGTVTCALGTLANAASATVQVLARPTAAGSLSNQASIASSPADPSSTNNTSTAGTTVSATAVGYPRPRGATPLLASLVPAYTPCTSPNRVHGPPLGSNSCNPPAQRSTYLTVGSPDANSRPANMVGSVRLSTLNGNAGSPADEADVKINLSVTDVRDRTTLADYAGELRGALVLRVTDRLNGATQNDSATGADTQFGFTAPCTPTGGAANIGSTCTLATSADAVMPGVVREIRRSIWQLDDILVMDGGLDGDADTAGDNTVFLRQGIFIP